MTPPSADLRTTVGDWVRQNPATSRVFENLGIDYCCGGKIPLDAACDKKGLNTSDVLRQLTETDGRAPEANADDMGLTELADHIEATHHAFLREELPRLDSMTRKVAGVHGEQEPRLREVRDVLSACMEELVSHMEKEEKVLFPMIRQLEASNGPVRFHCGSLANPIRMMEHEHDDAGDSLERISQLTDGYTPPDWACGTYRAMLDALRSFELDMHTHVHKENSILFPKALKLEAERTASGVD
jgi:regulator of cell morphogenesis and NO signaling